MFDFSEYAAQFNLGDDERLAERYFTEDFVYVGASQTISGRQDFLNFLKFAHDGVCEVMRPQKIFQNTDGLFVEIDMDFHALKARTDYPFGELKPGQMITVKFFVIYELREGKISGLKAAVWPPDYGVSRTPRLGAEPSQQAAFKAYLSAFNLKQFDMLQEYYTEDAVLALNGSPPIRGREAICNHYCTTSQNLHEEQVVNRVIMNTGSIAADITSQFTAKENAPATHLPTLAKGESIKQRFFIFYTLKKGLIDIIEIAEFDNAGNAPRQSWHFHN